MHRDLFIQENTALPNVDQRCGTQERSVSDSLIQVITWSNWKVCCIIF